jgi:predicted cobalt transporter CbtA
VTLTFGAVIKRALIVGALAGVLLAVYFAVVAEPTVDKAIALEDARTAAAGGHHEAPMFSRAQQVGGGMLAAVLYAGMVSAIFATVYAKIRHRIAARSDLHRVVLLAAVAFATTALVPMLKYPANPPAVGNPDTVNERTLQYVTLLAFSILAAVLIAKLSGWLRTRLDDPTRVAALVGATVLVYGTALVVFPGSPDAIDPSVPAGLIWRFRVQSLGSLALLWTVLGVGLGWALDRLTAAEVVPRRGDVPVPA